MRLKLVLLALVALILTGQSAALTGEVQAASTAGFSAGNIIDDGVFTHKSSMSVSQIQSFLNNKNSVCLKNFQTLSLYDSNNDGYGDEPYGKGQNEKVSAAKLIWQAAQIYDISPKVILVTLQKEQGLITRTDCPGWRYNTALGYGCPDSEPCNTAAYGFTRQIDYGVWHFRGFFDDSLDYVPYTPGTRKVYWHPDLSRCGSSTFNIQNRATASLYSYTPYRPNQAALDAGYGTGNSCSSYGNRNFWLYFTDWFGSTRGTPFFRISGSTKTYIEGANNTYYYVSSPSMMEAYGFGKSITKITTFSSGYLSGKTYKGNLPQVARFETDEVFIINRGERHHVPTRDMLTDYGLTLGEEAFLPNSTVGYLRQSSAVTNILMQADRLEIHLVEGGKKRHIGSREAYETLGSPVYSSRPAVTLSSFFARTVPNGAPVVTDGSYIRSTDTNKYWLWVDGSIRLVSTETAGRWGIVPNYASLESIITQLPATSVAYGVYVKSGTNHYLLDTGKKLLFTSEQMSALGLSSSSFVATTDQILDHFQEKPFTNLVRRVGTDAVYKIEGDELRHVYGREEMSYFSLSMNNVMSLSLQSMGLFENNGRRLLIDGRAVRADGQSAVYMINSTSTKRHIGSRELFDQFGYNMSDVIPLTTTAFQEYTAIDPLVRFVKYSDGSYWLVDSSRRYKISPTLFSSYGLQESSFVTIPRNAIVRLRLASNLTSLIGGSDGKIYKIEGGKKRWFASRESFESHGSWANVRILSDSYLASIPNGSSIH